METEHLLYVTQDYCNCCRTVCTCSWVAVDLPACANPLANISYNSGVDKYEQGDYQGAIADYTKAIEINPKFALAYFNRGLAKDKFRRIMKEQLLITIRQ